MWLDTLVCGHLWLRERHATRSKPARRALQLGDIRVESMRLVRPNRDKQDDDHEELDQQSADTKRIQRSSSTGGQIERLDKKPSVTNERSVVRMVSSPLYLEVEPETGRESKSALERPLSTKQHGAVITSSALYMDDEARKASGKYLDVEGTPVVAHDQEIFEQEESFMVPPEVRESASTFLSIATGDDSPESIDDLSTGEPLSRCATFGI